MGDIISMSKQDLSRLELIQKVIDKCLKQRQAAEQLSLSGRQIRRLCTLYVENGAHGLVSKRRGKASNRQMDPTIKQLIIDLIVKY